MPTVLVITEQERLRQLFATLEQEGNFRLRIAPTLAQGEEEMAVRLPDYVFVEDQISGLSGGIIIRYLRSLLPEQAEVILMVRQEADAEGIDEAAGLFLDLSDSDEALQQSIRDAIPRQALRQNSPSADPFPAHQKSARELLFDQPGREAPTGAGKRRLWLIPLVLAIISLSAVAYLTVKKAPPQPPAANVPAVAPEGIGSGSGTKKVLPPVATPASPQETRKQAAPKGLSKSKGASAPGTSGRYLHYVVKRGDNLQRILIRKFGFSAEAAEKVLPEIKRLNNLRDLKSLQPGQKIIIPAAPKQRKEAK